MLRIKAMNYGELDREDFGFSVAVGFPSRGPRCSGGRVLETVNGNGHYIMSAAHGIMISLGVIKRFFC